MDGPSDFADQLLAAAGRDAVVWRKLVGDRDVHDAMLGFHAQQAVEKCLKAVLARTGVAFRRTHDVAELMDVMADAGLPEPPYADRLDELSPYAVEARYGWSAAGALDRNSVTDWVEAVMAWAGRSIRGAGP